jgi:hypothetical protein
MMMEVTSDDSLEHIIYDCIERLKDHRDDKEQVIYRVYEYLCYAGVYQLAIPASLLKNSNYSEGALSGLRRRPKSGRVRV